MENIFFDTSYTSLTEMLIKVIAFLLISGLLLYVIYFALTKFLFRKNKHRKEINLRLVFLWTIFAYFILFNVYIFVLFYRNGIDSLHWTNAKIYLGIIAQLTIYIGLLAYFSSSSQTGSSFFFTGLYTLMLSGAMIYTSFILRKRTVNALYFFTILGVFEIAYFIDIYQKPSMASIVEFVILGWQILALIYLWINKNKLFLRD